MFQVCLNVTVLNSLVAASSVRENACIVSRLQRSAEVAAGEVRRGDDHRGLSTVVLGNDAGPTRRCSPVIHICWWKEKANKAELGGSWDIV